MNLGDTVLDALKFPFFNVSRSFGLFLLFVGIILIIPIIMAYGYILRIIKYTINGSNDLPPFDEWNEMFTDGLKYLVVTIIYLIIPNILTFLLFRGILTSIYSGNFQISAYLLATIMGLVIALPFDLVYIMSLGNVAHKGRLGAAFEFSKIFRLIRGIGWSVYFVYILTFVIIELLLSQISSFGLYLRISFGLEGLFIGIILSILITVYLSLYRGRFIGLIYFKGSRFTENDPEIEDNLELEENRDVGTV